MTQEERQLLLKDLCARQPYGVKFKAENEDSPIELHYVRDEDVYGRIYSNLPYWIEIIKPYLRPMSSMTEEEKKQFFKMKQMSVTVVVPNVNRLEIEYIVDLEDDGDGLNHLYDWLNAHHFDYRGLIEKGLAIEAPEDMYKTE